MDSAFSSYHNGGITREQDFKTLSQTIGTSILKISSNVSSMQKMVNQIGTSADSQELRNQLHQIRNYTHQLATDTKVHLKELSDLSNSASRSPGEQRQNKMQRERLHEELIAALNNFQIVQNLAMAKEKEIIKKTKANANIGIFGERKNDTLIELQDNRSQKEMQQFQMQEEMNLRMLEEQEAHIRELESNINGVNEIFKELGALVHDQGEVIDSIEASVERTEVFVSEGTSQLRQAANYKNKLRKKKAVLLGIAGTILILLILYIYFTSGSS